jgi:uncharacterized repeat protein (TIGR01451 family)
MILPSAIPLVVRILFPGCRRRDFMKHPLAYGVVMATVWLSTAPAHAEGTPACTDILNQATATYTIGEKQFTENSNVTTTVVAELLDVTVIWQDAADITVSPGDTDQVLTFLVTNTGNATDTYSLAGLSSLAGDDFDPVLVDLYLDANGNSIFDPGVDERYVLGVNDQTLDADEAIIVFVLNDIPIGLLDGDEGDSQLTATSNTGTGAPGTVVPGAADCGADAVVGASGGTDGDIGTYVVSNVVVTVIKSASVADPFGGAEPVPGALITYTITVAVSGSGTAEGVVITDSIPVHTTYSAGTLTLNAASLTDAADADAGDVGATTPGTVTVTLGDVAAGSPDQIITFTVVIN